MTRFVATRCGRWEFLQAQNKASSLLASLTESRDPRVLAELRADALSILGGIAGIEEEVLDGLIAGGQQDRIIDKLRD